MRLLCKKRSPSSCWPVLAALLVAAAWPGPSRGEVVAPGGEEEGGGGGAGFGACDAFFYQGAPPDEGIAAGEAEVAKICQRYKDEPRFATLYSRRQKVPLYAAFRYDAAPGEEQEQEQDREEQWMVEPQLDDPKNGLEGMMPESEAAGSVDNLGTNQALTADYEDSERGQLNPSTLHKNDHQIATYTLTNAVPMTPPLHEIWHWEVENLVSQSLAPQCGNGKDLYLVSGAVPSSLKVKDRVASPESLWLAACCDDGSGTWSVGFIKQAAAEDRLEDLSLEELEKKLPAGTQLFKNSCGQERHDPKKLEVVLQSTKKIRAQKPAYQHKKTTASQKTSTEKGKCGFLKNLFCSIVTCVCNLVKCVFSVIVQVVKYTFNLLCYIIKKIVMAVYNFIKEIACVLLTVVVDLIRVGVNILNGIAKNIYNVLMITYRIICIPVTMILDIVSFPFYVLGAVPAVLQDIVKGIGGFFLLVINCITNFVTCISNIVSHLAKKFLPKVSINA